MLRTCEFKKEKEKYNSITFLKKKTWGTMMTCGSKHNQVYL